jgi:hypothetical protein
LREALAEKVVEIRWADYMNLLKRQQKITVPPSIWWRPMKKISLTGYSIYNSQE